MGKGAVLVVIDMQEGFRHDVVEPAKERIFDLLAKFAPERTIFTLFKNLPDSQFERQLNWTRMQDEHDRRIMSEFKSVSKAAEIEHTEYSIYGVELKKILAKVNSPHVYLAGIFTDVCVAMAAMELFDANIEVSVLEDCVATLHGNDVHNATLKSLQYIIGPDHVINSPEIPL